MLLANSEVNMAGYWLSSFWHIMNLDEVQVHQSPNKILANIKPSLQNKLARSIKDLYRAKRFALLRIKNDLF